MFYDGVDFWIDFWHFLKAMSIFKKILYFIVHKCQPIKLFLHLYYDITKKEQFHLLINLTICKDKQGSKSLRT